MGSTPAMISPEFRPLPIFFAQYSMASKKALLAHRRGLARAEPREVLGVVELVAKREMVRAQIHEPVVLPEVFGGHHLDTHEGADSFL